MVGRLRCIYSVDPPLSVQTVGALPRPFSSSRTSTIGKVEQNPLLTRQNYYEEDVCDTSGCAVVALRRFPGERRANF